MPSQTTQFGHIFGAAAEVVATLNTRANLALLAGRVELATRAIRMAKRLTATNARLSNRVTALTAEGSLQPDIAALTSLAAEARRAKERLQSATAAIRAGQRLISILGRVVALLA